MRTHVVTMQPADLVGPATISGDDIVVDATGTLRIWLSGKIVFIAPQGCWSSVTISEPASAEAEAR